MASCVVRCPLTFHSVVRHYAAAAAAAAQCSSTVVPQCVGDKVVVATIDNNNPISQVSVVFKAGTRWESYDTQGITHHLRIAAGLTTNCSSTFAITRNIQQQGANIFATTDRETIAYTVQVTRDKLETVLPFLKDVSTGQLFRPWELSEQLPRLRYELSIVPELTKVIELLHKAAYRSGLGYSLYSPKRQIGKINSETLQHHVNNLFTESRCVVVATGVSLSEVRAFAQDLEFGNGVMMVTPAKYFGGEIRKERDSTLANVALAVEGAGLDKAKEAIAFAVVQAAAGSGPCVKWGTSTSSLYKAVLAAAGQDTFAISALNASYFDSGLFGFVLSAPPQIAGKLTKAGFKWLRSPNLSDADINRGKTALKASILYAADNNLSLLENLAFQAMHAECVDEKYTLESVASIVARIDKVSASDLKAVYDKLATGKLSMSAIGDLSSVPYIDQLY